MELDLVLFFFFSSSLRQQYGLSLRYIIRVVGSSTDMWALPPDAFAALSPRDVAGRVRGATKRIAARCSNEISRRHRHGLGTAARARRRRAVWRALVELGPRPRPFHRSVFGWYRSEYTHVPAFSERRQMTSGRARFNRGTPSNDYCEPAQAHKTFTTIPTAMA